MKLSTLLSITAVIALIFGLGLLIAPGPFMAPNGITLDASGVLFARSEAALLLGLAVINWLARGARDAAARRGLAAGNALAQFIALGVTVSAILAGTLNSAAWAPALVHLLLTLGFTTVLVTRRAGAVAPAA